MTASAVTTQESRTAIRMMDRVMAHSKAYGIDRMVLMTLARHDFGNGVYPSKARLAKMAGCSISSLQRAFDSLHLIGEMHRELRPGHSTIYKILLTCPEECTDQAAHGQVNSDLTPQLGQVNSDLGVRSTVTTRRVPQGNPSSPKGKKGGLGQAATLPQPKISDEAEAMIQRIIDCETEVDPEDGYWVNEAKRVATTAQAIKLSTSWHSVGRYDLFLHQCRGFIDMDAAL